MFIKVKERNLKAQKLKLRHVPRRVLKKVRNRKGSTCQETVNVIKPVSRAGRKRNQRKVLTLRSNQVNERKSYENLTIT